MDSASTETMADLATRGRRVNLRSLSASGSRALLRRLGLVVLTLIGGAVIGIVVDRLLSQPAANEMRVWTFTGWRLVCPRVTPQTPNCELSEDVVSDNGANVATIAMADPGQLSLRVPNGVLLEPGLGFSIGTEPVRVRPYETCVNQGCIALVTVDADTLKSLQTNMQAQMTVMLPTNTQPVNIPFSLAGFAQGYAELQKNRARRTSIFRYLSR